MIRCRFKKDISEKDENIKKGLECLSMAEGPLKVMNSHSEKNRYILLDWAEGDDEKVMMAIYYFQKSLYCYGLDEFKQLWESGEWEPDTVLSFPAEYFEVVK